LADDHNPPKKENEVVMNLNKIMPKVPTIRWGAVTNVYPTNAKINQMNRLLPHDRRWHLLFEEE